ncbi:MAG: translocation/assembly module TamB domain-containing protein [Polyangiaceae bacterium]
MARRVRAAARWLGYALGAALTVCLVALACVNTAPARNFIRERVNGALAGAFAGTLMVQRIGYIGPYSVGGVDAEVRDAHGKRVIVSRGLSASCRWPSIVADLLRKRPLTIVLTPASADHVELLLLDDGQGSPTLASAFAPRTASSPTTGAPGKSAPVTISLPELRVRHVWAHGGLAALPGIDSELLDLQAALRSRGSELDLSLGSVRLLARNLPERLNPRGHLKGKLSVTTELEAQADFDGELDGAPLKANAELRGRNVRAKVSAPALPPSFVSGRVAALSPRGPTAFELVASGTLPRIDFDGVVRGEAIDAKLGGHVLLRETVSAELTLHARGLDLSGIVPTAPASRLSLDAELEAKLPPSAPLTANYRVQLPAGVAQGVATPSVVVSGNLTQSNEQGLRVEGAVRADEPGARALGNYLFRIDARQRQSLKADLSLDLRDPKRLKKLAGVALSGTVQANAELDLSSERIQAARVTLALGPLARGQERVGSLNASVVASGALSDPQLELSARATRGEVSGQSFRSLELRGRGTPTRLQLDGKLTRDPQELEFSTTLANGGATSLSALSLSLAVPKQEPVSVRIRELSVRGGNVRVDGLELDGAGSASLSGSYGAGRTDAEFELQNLDVARLSRALRVQAPLQAARVSAKGHLKGPLSRLQGALEAHVDSIDLEHVQGGRVDLDLQVEAQRASGTLEASLGDSRVSARLADVLVPAPGASLGPGALRGHIEVTGELQLSRAVAWLRAVGVPIESAAGRVELAVNAESREQGGLPKASLSVKTSGLKLVQERPRQVYESNADARSTQPLALDGVDVDAQVVFDPEREQLELVGKLFDERGPIVRVEAKSGLPLQSASLPNLPLKLAVSVPGRELSELPRSLRPPSIFGVVSAQIEAEGTLREPRLVAGAGVRGFRTRDGGRRALDAEMMLRYDAAGGELRASASSSRKTHALLLSSQWQGDLIGKLTNPARGQLDLDAELHLDEFPIGMVPMLSDRSLRGPLSCDVKLAGFGKDAKLSGSVDGRALRLGTKQLQKLELSFETEPKLVRARLDVRDADGSLLASAQTPFTWGSALLPTLDPRAQLELKARRFQLEALSPFVMQYVSALEGQLDADLSAQLGEGAPKLQGSAELREGVLQIPQIGQRFSDVSGKLSLDAAGHIKLQSLSARGTSGRVTAQAEATLRGAELESAKASAQIKKSEKLPITLEGVALGDAWGKLDVSYRKQNEDSEIRVDVPQFEIEMPEAGFGDVQGLDPDAHVRVGVFRRDGSFAELPLQPLRASDTSSNEAVGGGTTRVHVHLGDSVWVQRGTQATVQLGGDLTLTSGDRAELEGRIELRGGKLDVNGKTFDIETGAVSFSGADSSNPIITATARWDAPDATAVYAEYRGTAKAGKLTLHSEPPLSQPGNREPAFVRQPGRVAR